MLQNIIIYWYEGATYMKVTYEEHLEKRKRDERNNTRFIRNVTKRQICRRQEVRRNKYGKSRYFEEEYA